MRYGRNDGSIRFACGRQASAVKQFKVRHALLAQSDPQDRTQSHTEEAIAEDESITQKGAAVLFMVTLLCATAYAAIVGVKKEGLVEYVGAQKDVFMSGKATSVVSLEDLAGR